MYRKSVEMMIGDVIRKFGYEDKRTIEFVNLCDTDNIIKIRALHFELMTFVSRLEEE